MSYELKRIKEHPNRNCQAKETNWQYQYSQSYINIKPRVKITNFFVLILANLTIDLPINLCAKPYALVFLTYEEFFTPKCDY